MTTIAFRDGIIASDGLATYGDSKVPADMRKLFCLTDGSVAGVSGSEGLWRRVLAWIESDRVEPQPSATDDNRYTVAVLKPNGDVEIFEDGYHFIEPSDFMAYGSGQAAALGALHAGCSAEEAVRIATLVDKNSGGTVRAIKVERKLSVAA